MGNPKAQDRRDYFERRRLEIKQRLAADGFGSQGLNFSRRARSESSDNDAAERLRDTLPSLGPVFASFGLYLSSRPDLLSLTDCLTLAAIPNCAAPTPAQEVRRLVHDELCAETDGTSPAERFVRFDPEPFESRLLFQLHYGELDNGDRVVVKVIHPRVRLEDELKLLTLLAVAVVPRLSDAEQFSSLIADFRSEVLEAVDCRRVSESLEALSHDMRDTDKLTVAKVYLDLCSRNVLVTERLDGLRLDHYLAKCHARRDQSSESSGSIHGIVADELARQLCDVWLRQAFDGTILPVDVRPESILIRSPTEFAIVDGTFTILPRASKENLLSYLVANAADEPGKALAALLHELDGSNRRISDSTLDRQFRQVVSFRDGGWDDGGRANCLSDTLFAQWRLASSHGYRPLRHLSQMYRGTFHIAALARQLAPDRDSLLEGVKDLRLTKLLHDIGTMMQPSYWGGQADKIAALMMLGPGHLDGALKAAVDKYESQDKRRVVPRSPATSWNFLLSALLALLSFTLVRERIGLALPDQWSEILSAVIFVALGALIIQLLTSAADS